MRLGSKEEAERKPCYQLCPNTICKCTEKDCYYFYLVEEKFRYG